MALQLQHIEVLGEYFTHYYLCNYRPRSVGSDQLSDSLIRFKECRRVDVEAWTECSILELTKVRFGEDLHIIRALNADEVKATKESRTALDWFGRRLEIDGLGKFYPDVLYKLKAVRSIKKLSKAEREIELDGIYQFVQMDSAHILVLDHILTTGTTMKAIIKAIRLVLPECKISLFTLANTDHQAMLNKEIALSGNTYLWNDDEWASTITEPEELYAEVIALKKKILNDSFDL